jgi:hypothetical protein
MHVDPAEIHASAHDSIESNSNSPPIVSIPYSFFSADRPAAGSPKCTNASWEQSLMVVVVVAVTVVTVDTLLLVSVTDESVIEVPVTVVEDAVPVVSVPVVED